MSEKETRYGILIALLIVPMLIVPIGISVGNTIGPQYEYNLKVHSYIENAYYANTPELMISNLQKCEQGMRDLGLTDSMYDAFWPWDKTPNKQMAYQYQHIDSIISRAEAVIIWRNDNYGNNSSGVSPESLGDVYEMKMDNLRGFLQEGGWSDWIADGAFYANFHLVYYLGGLISTIWIIIFAIPIAIFIIKWWIRDG